MARAQQTVSDSKQDNPALALPEQVTYLAGPEDPVETTFMRHKFRANVPRQVSDPNLIEVARNHRYFKVGDFDPDRDVLRTDMAGPPKTAEAYRRWAVEWMKKIPDVEAACQKWSTEARIRAQLEVGFDDYKYISDFFQPILSELIKREDDPRGTRDMIVRQGEFADLFLQVNRVGEAA